MTTHRLQTCTVAEPDHPDYRNINLLTMLSKLALALLLGLVFVAVLLAG